VLDQPMRDPFAMASFVPIVDMSRVHEPDHRAALALQIDDACRTVGFLQIVGHGVDPDIIDAMLGAVDVLFDQPLADKLSWRPPSPQVNRGYAPMGTEALSYSVGHETPPDLFEAFNLGPDHVPDNPIYNARRHDLFADNIWPSIDGIREPIVRYFDAAATLARRLTGLFAESLGLPGDFFHDKTDHSTDTMRINHYVRSPGDPEPVGGQLRMGAHSDYGIVTVLYADMVPGLEIVAPDGTWQSVLPEPGAFLVNLGDLTAQWTNDRWRSTLHRVVPPPRLADGPARRRSVAFFHDGNYDALIECLDTCVSADHPAKYSPVIAGEHLMAKLLAPRTLTATTASLDTSAGRLTVADQP
jgi:isopenicillin N synthase-like dioxygenase